MAGVLGILGGDLQVDAFLTATGAPRVAVAAIGNDSGVVRVTLSVTKAKALITALVEAVAEAEVLHAREEALVEAALARR